MDPFGCGHIESLRPVGNERLLVGKSFEEVSCIVSGSCRHHWWFGVAKLCDRLREIKGLALDHAARAFPPVRSQPESGGDGGQVLLALYAKRCAVARPQPDERGRRAEILLGGERCTSAGLIKVNPVGGECR